MEVVLTKYQLNARLEELIRKTYKYYKLRPEIDRQTRLQLVLKALLTIGDLPDQMQAAMVVGVCAEMDKSDVDNVETNSQNKDSSGVDTSTGRKVVRRSSAK